MLFSQNSEENPINESMTKESSRPPNKSQLNLNDMFNDLTKLAQQPAQKKLEEDDILLKENELEDMVESNKAKYLYSNKGQNISKKYEELEKNQMEFFNKLNLNADSKKKVFGIGELENNYESLNRELLYFQHPIKGNLIITPNMQNLTSGTGKDCFGSTFKKAGTKGQVKNFKFTLENLNE